MAEHFIVRRSGALGDAILVTPVLRRLRREYPDALIRVATAYAEVFAHNPHLVNTIWQGDNAPVLLDCDLAYEKRPAMHIVRAYMQEVFGDSGEPEELQQELFYNFGLPVTPDYAPSKYVALHTAVAGWRNRTLPRQVWRDVVTGIEKLGYTPVLVGTRRDLLSGSMAFTAMLDRPLLEQARFIAGCAAFVGSDSALLHVAGATKTPIVGVFTCALPQTRLPFRHGELGWRCEVVVPDLPCVGCLARRAAPVTTEHCDLAPSLDSVCVEKIAAESILAALQKLVRG